MKRFALAAVMLAIGCSASLADDCVRSRSVYTQSYIAPSVVSVPTYNYSYAQTTLLVPQVVEVATYAPNHVYGIQDGYSAAQIIDALTRHDQQLLQGQQSVQPTQQPPPLPQQPAPVPQPVPQPAIQPRTSGPVRPSSFQDPVLIGLIQQSCVKCHQAQNKMPLLTPDGKALLDLNRQQALTVYWLVNTGSMPKTASPVEDKFMPLFAKWIEASK